MYRSYNDRYVGKVGEDIMNKFIKIIIAFLLIVPFLVACSNTAGEEAKTELVISTASSLKEAMEDIQHTYEEEHPHIKLRFNFGASGSLQQQISQGAPVDLFFSAAEDKLDLLVKEGLMDKNDFTDLLGNELVLIVQNGRKTTLNSFQDLNKQEVEKISIGMPETVPAGKYAKESLQNLGIWNDIDYKIVFAKDVRQVLSYVETGNVVAGIVYKTDVISSEKIKVIASVEEQMHTPIIYPLGIIKDTKHYEEAKDFYDYLRSEKGLKVFEDYGFTIN